jgi:hypothetical protein
MRQDMTVSAATMLEACGAKNINTFVENSPPGLCIHEMGTARACDYTVNQMKRSKI